MSIEAILYKNPAVLDYVKESNILALVTSNNFFDLSEELANHIGISNAFTKITDDIFEVEYKKEKRRGGKIYHGLMHTLLVFLASMEGAYACGITKMSDIRNLALAALMHDYGHTCGDCDDDVNIEIACAAANIKMFGTVEEINTQQIKAAIRATRFPWNTVNKTSEISKILRDADLMYPYVKDPNIVKQLTTGLFNEMFPDVVYEEATEATKELFKDMKCKFHTTFVWNTRWAKMKAFKYNYPILSRN